MNYHRNADQGSYLDIIERCAAEGGEWTDDAFPPTNGSFCFPEDWKDKEVPFDQLEWVRASKMPSLLDDDGELTLFGEGISPADIKQGALGCCYFLSAISSLAVYPEKIMDLFLTKEVNEQGVFAVQLYREGRRIEVVVDNHLPSRHHEPYFARSHGKQLWVMILEKAYAKLHGNYQAISTGFPSDALTDLSGAPGLLVGFGGLAKS